MPWGLSSSFAPMAAHTSTASKLSVSGSKGNTSVGGPSARCPSAFNQVDSTIGEYTLVTRGVLPGSTDRTLVWKQNVAPSCSASSRISKAN